MHAACFAADPTHDVDAGGSFTCRGLLGGRDSLAPGSLRALATRGLGCFPGHRACSSSKSSPTLSGTRATGTTRRAQCERRFGRRNSRASSRRCASSRRRVPPRIEGSAAATAPLAERVHRSGEVESQSSTSGEAGFAGGARARCRPLLRARCASRRLPRRAPASWLPGPGRLRPRRAG